MEENKLPLSETTVQSNEESLELYSADVPFSLSLRIKNFQNEAEFVKFVRSCEKLVRGCIEYKLWKNYIRDVLQVNNCAVTHERMDMVTVEIHHHIPTLFLMIKAIVNKRVQSDKEFSSFDICLETMELHFMNKVGYVCLVSTIHEKVHNKYLAVPIELVKGNYKAFLLEYGQYLDTEDLERINESLSVKLETISPDQLNSWTVDNYPGLKPVSIGAS